MSLLIKLQQCVLYQGALKSYDGSQPSLYVGETARSLQERSCARLSAFRSINQTSVILKHQEQCHEGSREPKFVFKVVGACKIALSRQIVEAIKIRNRGGEGAILKASQTTN